jgi:hypothetical protein
VNLSLFSVQTSYVNVEPKRRRQGPPQSGMTPIETGIAVAASVQQQHYHTQQHQQQYVVSGDVSSAAGVDHPSEGGGRPTTSGRELRRARIVITVKRTASYKQWLDDNPLQTVIAEDDDIEDVDDDAIDAGIVGTDEQEL